MLFVFKDNTLKVIFEKNFAKSKAENISKALFNLMESVYKKPISYYEHVMNQVKERIEINRKA